MTQGLERPLPNSLEAEEAIIGGVLLDSELLTQAAERLQPADFYHPRNRVVFAAMLGLLEEGSPIDPITIGERISLTGYVDSVGGVAAITRMSFGIPQFSDLSDYVEIVYDKSRLRQLIRACTKISGDVLAQD